MTPAEAINALGGPSKAHELIDTALMMHEGESVTLFVDGVRMDALCILALHALTDSDAWMGKLCEDSAKIDKEVDRVHNSMRRCPLDEHSFRAHYGAFVVYGDEIDEAVRIMRTRGDALRAAEKERDEFRAIIEEHHNGYRGPDANCGCERPATHKDALLDLIKEQKSLEGYEVRDLRAELARLRAEAKPRDEAEDVETQDAYDAMCASSFANIDWSESVEFLLGWCVRKLGGARG